MDHPLVILAVAAAMIGALVIGLRIRRRRHIARSRHSERIEITIVPKDRPPRDP